MTVTAAVSRLKEIQAKGPNTEAQKIVEVGALTPNNAARSRMDGDCCMSADLLIDHFVIELIFNPPGVHCRNKSNRKFSSSLFKNASHLKMVLNHKH